MELIRPATRLERPAARRLDDAGTAHPAVPLASRSTAPSGAGRPVQPAQPIPRIYSPAELEFAHIPDRHECWYRLSEPVRELLTERAGGILAWWAAPDDQGRTWAVVLGTKALITPTPSLNSSDGPNTEVRTIVSLEPSSLRETEIRQPIAWRSPNSPHRGFDPVQLEPAHTVQLDPTVAALVGNLPPQAQAFLQEPFLGRRENFQQSCYYFRTLYTNSAQLFVGAYLAGVHHLTFVSGTRFTPTGVSDEASEWQLVCCRATVHH